MDRTMRALVLNAEPMFRDDYPVPGPGPDEALVRVTQAGICGTDLEIIQGYASFQGVMGHEFVGVVERCASAPDLVGRRVVGEINVSCGQCVKCRRGLFVHCARRTTLGIHERDGAFADYLTLPAANLHVVPQRVSDDQAIFVEPLAAALQILEQVHVRPSHRVVVIGAGKLGLLIVQALALTGCHLTLIGRHPDKLELAARRGIDTRLSEPLPDLAADIAVEATGSLGGLATARRLLRPRGTIVLKSTYHGMAEIDLIGMVVDEVTVVGSRCGPFAPALRLLAQNIVDVPPLIEARYPLEEGVAALERAGQRGALKVLLEMETR